CRRYTSESGTFVTAFYGIYDPAARTLTYACAGHNPPRLRLGRNQTMSLDGVNGVPLGIVENETYAEATRSLRPGDLVVFYTDGISEAFSDTGEMFGVERMDEVLAEASGSAQEVVEAILGAVGRFSGSRPPGDDRTLIAARVT